MKVVRKITYDFASREALDRQQMMPDFVPYPAGAGNTITVETLQDDRRVVNCFPGVEFKERVDVVRNPCKCGATIQRAYDEYSLHRCQFDEGHAGAHACRARHCDVTWESII